MLVFMCVCFLGNLQLIANQFADHVDLQRITDIMFKNQRYYVLKPTVHKVEDYFKTFVLKRSNDPMSSGRILIDKNGFRHSWKGMELIAPESLRKAYVKINNDNESKSVRSVKHNLNVKNADEIINETNTHRTIDERRFNMMVANDSQIKNVKEKPRRKKIVHNMYVPAKPAQRQRATQIRTTFFCPHFGVVRMTANVENFEELEDTA